MPGLILVAAAAGSFTCLVPSAIDGDTLRCANTERSLRLAGIDTPEMPGHCRRGRVCTPGDPYAARDHLRGLMRWHLVECIDTGSDRYGRIIARCTAGETDLSCAMIASGHAAARYGAIDCPMGGRGRRAAASPQRHWPALPLPLVMIGAVWLMFANVRQWRMAATRWPRRNVFRRIGRHMPAVPFLGMALLGGWPAAILALTRLEAGRQQQWLERAIMAIATLHVGLAMGVGLWWLRH